MLSASAEGLRPSASVRANTWAGRDKSRSTEAAAGARSDAAALAHHVLDTIAALALRETLRLRLRALDRDLLIDWPVGSAG
jgi:hypothetical protein